MTTADHVKRYLGIFAVAFIGLFGALTFGGTASAHHPVLSATTSLNCDDETWSAIVTAVSDRDWNKDWRSRHRVNDDLYGNWSDVVDDQVPYVVEVGPFPATEASVVVTVASEWFLTDTGQRSAQGTRSFAIERPPVPQDCDQEVTPVTPSAGYDCTDNEIVPNFSDTDAYTYSVDITDPADGGEGDTWAITITATPTPGHSFPADATSTWNFSGTIDCNVDVTPVTPNATYDCDGGLISTEFTNTDAYTYSVDITDPADGGQGDTWAITITATPTPGHEFVPGATTTWNFSGTIDCDQTEIVTPVAPTADYDCTDNEIVPNFSDTDAYTYSVDITDPADGGEGDTWAITITATPTPGHEFVPGATTTWNFSGTIDCDQTEIVTPVAPTADYDCTDNEIVPNFTNSDAYTYSVDITDPADGGEGDTWAITITATPTPGHSFPADATTTWNFSGTIDCNVEVTPVAPTATYDCDGGLISTEFTNSDAYTYSVDITDPADGGQGDTWAITITATPTPGHELVPGATTTWNFSGTIDCDQTEIVTPVAPTADYDCTDNEIVPNFTNTDAYTYTVDITDPADGGEGDTWAITITATPTPGHSFPADATTTWNFSGTIDCDQTEIVTPVAPTADYDCTDNEIVPNFTNSDAYTYTVDITDPADGGEGDTWAITITATPTPGHSFPADATTTWNFSGTIDCNVDVTPVTPNATYDCDGGLISTEFTNTDAYTYTVDITDPADGGQGDTWAITITATPTPGHEFVPGATTTWNFSGTIDCDDVAQGAVTTTTTPTATTTPPGGVLPRTGSSATSMMLAYAALMTLGGGALLLVRRMSAPRA